jgi:hypothetical protein
LGFQHFASRAGWHAMGIGLAWCGASVPLGPVLHHVCLSCPSVKCLVGLCLRIALLLKCSSQHDMYAVCCCPQGRLVAGNHRVISKAQHWAAVGFPAESHPTAYIFK